MRIAIDISQTAHENTGVANFLEKLVDGLLVADDGNEYILFGSSLRNNTKYKVLSTKYKNKTKLTFKFFRLPPTFLDLLWNRLHILSIESLIGKVDVFISSDWIQPPTKSAKKVTILYDLIVYKYPAETHKKIVNTQKRRLNWVKKECDSVICISEATKKDAIDILEIDEKKISVVYPGI